LEPLDQGHYIGEADLDAGPERAERSFTTDAWRRLAALRMRHDPEGRFAGFPLSR
jgi:hypothetical protein